MVRVTHPIGIDTSPEITNQYYSMYNTGGIELETGEFLYSLVRITKPKLIVETGTHIGISSLYMASGLAENEFNGVFDTKLITCEIFKELIIVAQKLWKDNGVDKFISIYEGYSLELDIQKEKIDILFLDSEPQYRYDELLKFYNQVRPGGFIIIHDLPPLMKCKEAKSPETCPLFGNYKEKIGHLIKSFKLIPIHIPCPRGMVLFQKEDKSFDTTKYMRS